MEVDSASGSAFFPNFSTLSLTSAVVSPLEGSTFSSSRTSLTGLVNHSMFLNFLACKFAKQTARHFKIKRLYLTGTGHFVMFLGGRRRQGILMEVRMFVKWPLQNIEPLIQPLTALSLHVIND